MSWVWGGHRGPGSLGCREMEFDTLWEARGKGTGDGMEPAHEGAATLQREPPVGCRDPKGTVT